MKTRTILGLLMVAMLLLTGSASALEEPTAAPTLKVVPGGWCDSTNVPLGGILLEATGGASPYTPVVTPVLPGYTIWTGCNWGNCYLDVWTPVMSRNILYVTVQDSNGDVSNTIPVYVVAGHQGVNAIVGSDGADMLFGLDGWDTLIGNGGNDLLCGGASNDTLKGNWGLDTLSGGSGNDRCNGGRPNPGLDPAPYDVDDGTCEVTVDIP
jgi:hypothetical protein